MVEAMWILESMGWTPKSSVKYVERQNSEREKFRFWFLSAFLKNNFSKLVIENFAST